MAQGGPGRLHSHGPMVRERGVLYNRPTAVGRVRCQVASRRGERESLTSPSRRQVWRETVRLGQVARA